MSLATELKQARAKLGLSQSQAAEAWGIPLGTLKGYEKSQRQPRGLAMTKLLEILASVEATSTSASLALPGDTGASTRRSRTSKGTKPEG